MLTPVRAASNASFSLQAQTAAISTDGLVRAASAVVPIQPLENADLRSSIAGKLNVLLLAVRVRMIEALLEVLNASGDALAAPRADDESTLAFASRLVDAIQKLPPGKIEVVERQLAAQGHSIPLRMLAEALKNPAGPDAARIAAYLESTRYKDRDLATRAVVRSYGQNDGSPPRSEQRAEISIHRDNLSQNPRLLQVTADDDETKAPAANATAVAAYLDAEFEAQPSVSLKIFIDTPEHAAGQAAALQSDATGADELMADDSERLQASEGETQTGQVEDAGETAPASTQVRAAGSDPAIPKNWPGIPASMTDEATDLIVAIIRDKESEVLLEAVDVDPAVEMDAILDDTLLTDIPEPLARLPDAPARDTTATKPSAVLPQTQSAETAAATEAGKRQAAAPEPHPALREAMDPTYLPVLMKIVDGVPFATQPHQFAKDETEGGGSDEMYREDHDSGPEQEEEQSEPEGEEQAELAAEGVQTNEPDVVPVSDGMAPEVKARLLPAPGLAMQPIPDEAYARYRRMVDWE